MGGIGEILAGYDGLQAGQEAFYKDLHRHPELSHAEHRTAGRVAERLQDYGFTVQAGIGGTGRARMRGGLAAAAAFWVKLCSGVRGTGR